ncbi:MAG: hypothetical protein QOC60_1427 [Frankiaceae bacterium]|nr:hypothetical protein [Frankiaceae bacterium]MDQ1715482.1 hypothetical protein [Frankiaceae bacterium]
MTAIGEQHAGESGARPEQSVAQVTVPAQGRGPASKKPTPRRRGEFSHLTLAGLREYRTTLTDEEGRVSYWRRVIQARLDLVRAFAGGAAPADNLRDVLSGMNVLSSRGALATFVGDVDLPALPNLAELWSRDPRRDDDEHNAALEGELATAEEQLSSYRTILHEQLTAATEDLIARYHDEPSLCLIALPRGERAGV